MKAVLALLLGLSFSSAAFACEVPSAISILNSFQKRGFNRYNLNTPLDNDFNAFDQAYAEATWEFVAKMPSVGPQEVYAAMGANCSYVSKDIFMTHTIYKITPRCLGKGFAKIAHKYNCSIR